jgi:hypothetical protein
MDSGMIFTLALAILFFSTSAWLVAYSRRREQQGERTSRLSPKERRGLGRGAGREIGFGVATDDSAERGSRFAIHRPSKRVIRHLTFPWKGSLARTSPL